MADLHDIFKGDEQRLLSTEEGIRRLHGGGGGGTSDVMERLARLETDMQNVSKALERIEGRLGALSAISTDIAGMKEIVRPVPTIATEVAKLTENTRPVAGLVTDVASLKENLRHLPSKEELGAKLRTYLALSIPFIGVVLAGITLLLRVIGAEK